MKRTFLILSIFFSLFVSSIQANDIISENGYVKQTVVIKKDIGIQTIPPDTVQIFYSNPVLADGISYSTVRVSIFAPKDGIGRDNQVVTLININGYPATSIIQPTPNPTDSTGIAIGKVKSTTAGGTAMIAVNIKDNYTGWQANVDTLYIDFVGLGSGPGLSSITAIPDTVRVYESISDSSILQIVIKDASGRPIPNVPASTITISLDNYAGTSSPGWLHQPSQINPPPYDGTDLQGRIKGSIASTLVGSKVVTLKIGGKTTASDTIYFRYGTADKSVSTVVVTKGTAKADSVDSCFVTVTSKDKYGNIVPNTPVDLVVVSGSSNYISYNPSNRLTNSNGVCTIVWKSTKAEQKTFKIAFNNNLKSDLYSLTFTPGPLNAIASSISLVNNDSVATADNIDSCVVSVVAMDKYFNRISNVIVTGVVTGTANTITYTPATGRTDEQGTARVRVVSVKAERKQLSVTLTGTLNQITKGPVNLIFLGGSVVVKNCLLYTTKSTAIADSVDSCLVNVLARDQYLNPVKGANVRLNITVGTSNYLKYIPSSAQTDSNGYCYIEWRSKKAEGKQARATVNNLPLTNTISVTFRPGPLNTAMSSVVILPDTIAVADKNDTCTVRVFACDKYLNPIPVLPVNFAFTGTNNFITYTPTDKMTSSNGMVYARVRSTKAERKSVAVTIDTAFIGTYYFTFTSGNVNADSSKIFVSKSTIVANNIDSTIVSIVAKDLYGNRISNARATLSITGSNNFTIPTPPTVTTNDTGYAFITLKSTKAEKKTISAVINGISVKQTRTVTFIAGAIDTTKSTFSILPDTTVIADGVDTCQIKITVLDSYSNPKSNVPVKIYVSGSANNLVITPTNGLTDVNGNLKGVLRSTFAELKMVTVNVDTFSLGSRYVNFIPGNPSADSSRLYVDKKTIVADNVDSCVIRVVAKDSKGNLISNVPVVLSITGTNNFFTPSATDTTDSIGECRILLRSTKAESKTIRARIKGVLIKQTQTVTFIPGPPDTGTSIVAILPDTIVVADGKDTCNIQVSVFDAYYNKVKTAVVGITVIGGINDSLTINPSNGIADTVRGTLKGTVAGLRTIRITLAGLQMRDRYVTFIPGAVSIDSSNILAIPTTVVANGVDTCLITVIAKDAKGNRVPNANVVVTATGTNNIFTPTNATVKTDSIGEGRVILRSTKAEVKRVRARINNLLIKQYRDVNFIPGPPDTSLIANKTTIIANNIDTTVITLTIADSTGNPTSFMGSIYIASGTGNIVPLSTASSLIYQQSDANGQIKAKFSTIKAGRNVIKAKIFAKPPVDVSDSLVISAIAGPVSPELSTISTNKDSVADNMIDFATITVTLKDAYSNPIVGSPVVLSSRFKGRRGKVQDFKGARKQGVDGQEVRKQGNKGKGASAPLADSLVQPIALTDSLGRAFGYIYSDTIGMSIIKARGGGVLLDDSVVVYFYPELPSGTFRLTANPESLYADGLQISRVSSDTIYLNTGFIVEDNTPFWVGTTAGTVGRDSSSARFDTCYVRAINGTISFVVRSGTASGNALITARSVKGTARGTVTIVFYGNTSYRVNPTALPVFPIANPFTPDVKDMELLISKNEFGNNPANISVKIYDMSGTLVKVLKVENLSTSAVGYITNPNDYYVAKWNGKYDSGKNAPIGIYVYQVVGNGKVKNGIIGLAR